MKLNSVIFDLDGTLLDTSEGVLNSVDHTVARMGWDAPDESVRKGFIGPPISESFQRYYGCDAQTALRAMDIFRADYQSRTLFQATPYDGIYTACERLLARGIRLAVATYKREDYALRLLCHFGFDRLCESIHGADPDGRLKKRDILRLCQRELQSWPETSVLVGDTKYDAVGAAEAATPFLAVTYGFGFRSAGDAAEYPHVGVAATAGEIPEILEALTDARDVR